MHTPSPRLHRRSCTALLAASVLACITGAQFGASVAFAQAPSYPVKPVRLVVPFPAGGATDAAARELAEGLSKLLGQAFLVDNRPGADGAIAAQHVLSAPADGYTLFFASSSIEGVPLVQKGTQFASLNDFTPVSLVCRLSFGVIVHPDVPARSVQELVAYAKAHPGKLNVGSGSLSEQMAMSQFMRATGTDLVRVNYRGGAQVVPDLVAGQVHLSFGPLTPMLPMLRDQRLRLLGVLGEQRATVTPDAPSLRESGIAGVSGAGGLQAVLAPPGMAPEIVERLSASIRAVMADPAIQAKFVQRGQEPKTTTPAELAALLSDERAQWSRFAATEGLKAE